MLYLPVKSYSGMLSKLPIPSGSDLPSIQLNSVIVVFQNKIQQFHHYNCKFTMLASTVKTKVKCGPKLSNSNEYQPFQSSATIKFRRHTS